MRSFEDVVEQIRASIITGTLPVGERLPSERELAEMFGVSRPTLREALRVLEAVGLLDIRLGAQGGAFAGGDGHAPTTVISALLATHAATRPDDLRELRATHHADNAYWVEAERFAALLDSGTPTDEPELLRLLAAATDNKLRTVLTEAIELAIAEAQIATTPLGNDAQIAVVRLICDRDRAGARDLVYARLSTRSRSASAYASS